MSNHANDSVLTEQIAYYEARAPEYDEWIDRHGHYDRGPDANANWHRELDDVRQRLIAANLTGDILEFAPGTGNWTEIVARTATTLTAIDASAAMIAENRARLTGLGLGDNITYLKDDLFTWQPDRQYDAIVMGFFLSHVPDDLLDPFLNTISTALKPGGRLFLVDSRHTQTSSRPDSPYPALDDPLTVRHLNDGRAFTIYKLFRNPTNLATAFARHNITFFGEETDEYFVFGFGEKLG